MKPNPPEIKILVLGEDRVGKTSLIQSFCGDRRFIAQAAQPTDHSFTPPIYSIQNTEFHACFWEVFNDCSDPNFQAEFYSEVKGVLIVFDLHSRNSFTELNKWIKTAKEVGVDLSFAVLCGNKADLHNLEVSNEEATKWGKKLGIPYFATSTWTAMNTFEAFTQLFAPILPTLDWVW
jgi:small GTP-binding protein